MFPILKVKVNLRNNELSVSPFTMANNNMAISDSLQ